MASGHLACLSHSHMNSFDRPLARLEQGHGTLTSVLTLLFPLSTVSTVWISPHTRAMNS